MCLFWLKILFPVQRIQSLNAPRWNWLYQKNRSIARCANYFSTKIKLCNISQKSNDINKANIRWVIERSDMTILDMCHKQYCFLKFFFVSWIFVLLFPFFSNLHFFWKHVSALQLWYSVCSSSILDTKQMNY